MPEELFTIKYTTQRALTFYGRLKNLTPKNYHFIIKNPGTLYGSKGELWVLHIYDDKLNKYSLVKIFQPERGENPLFSFNFKLLRALEQHKL